MGSLLRPPKSFTFDCALAFTLQALKLRPRSQAWGLQATNTLPTWEIVPADILDGISDQEVPSSEYRPPKTEEFLRSSPIQLRRRRRNPSTSDCRPLHVHNNSDEDDDPHTPSRNPHVSRKVNRSRPVLASQTSTTAGRSSFSEENHRRYCTLKCLSGLVHGGELGQLDQACPNVRDHGHGTTRHVINSKTFVRKLQRQLSETVNADCEVIGIHGSRGALVPCRSSVIISDMKQLYTTNFVQSRAYTSLSTSEALT
ncbi:hypothetical protein N7474_006131 [Penicillium riverlandense]|uniref:uncharacterized protein n=1 Tax=Penicillium riverlandense TaxID=1903569 RepID=UPI00254671CB|nr:uncharacterized protein N7474_006131 [Penicillium riverlandense]KAJ5820540.1 hypothetical protein N7474_006131 [Penicillium riverlandense]